MQIKHSFQHYINKRYDNNTVNHSPFLLIDNDAVYCSLNFVGGANLRAFPPSVPGDTLGFHNHPPLFGEHILMLTLSVLVSLLIMVFVIFNRG